MNKIKSICAILISSLLIISISSPTFAATTFSLEDNVMKSSLKSYGVNLAPLDGVLKKVELDHFENNVSNRIIRYDLCADRYPGLIYLN